jgi:hypothetical protein
VSCGSKRLRKYDAVIAPFIAKRVWDSPTPSANLMFCKDCGMTFFNPRLSDEEMSRLYRDYRGEEYQRVRQQVEPGYTVDDNDMLKSSTTYLDLRKRTIVEFIAKRVDLAKIKTVLDFGGDRGQYFSDDFRESERFVYDISGVELVEGVQRYDGKQNRTFDMLLCCHVLEHLSYPRLILDRIKMCGDRSTLFYFEVPWEYPLVSPHEGLRGKIELFIISHPVFYNNYNKIKKYKFKMHEHINYFNEKSLSNLLTMNGFEILALERVALTGDRIGTNVISCLAKKKEN